MDNLYKFLLYRVGTNMNLFTMKNITLYFIILFAININGQNHSQLKGAESKVFTVLDTIRIKKPYVTFNIKWMNDTIQIQKWAYPLDIESELDKFIKATKFKDWVPSENEKKEMVIQKKIGAHNCYSNALKYYFEFNNLDFSFVFNDSTSVRNMKGFEKIINSSFILIKDYSIKNKRKIKNTEFQNGSLIVFRNKNGNAIHTIFYNDNNFYSKNGRWKELKYNKIEDIIKRYFDTTIIQIYELNKNAILNYIS